MKIYHGSIERLICSCLFSQGLGLVMAPDEVSRLRPFILSPFPQLRLTLRELNSGFSGRVPPSEEFQGDC